MKIEDVICEMRDCLLHSRIPKPMEVADWADTLEQHMTESITPKQLAKKIRAAAEVPIQHNYLHYAPPQEVIEKWPEAMPWVIKCGGSWSRFGAIHLQEVLTWKDADPRTLHHRSKFYPEHKK